MNDAALLAAVKTDLGIKTNAYDDRISARIQTAKDWIAAEGATLKNSAGDDELVVMYAAWLWRSRMTGEGMPRMLRFALNNRVFGEKAGNANA